MTESHELDITSNPASAATHEESKLEDLKSFGDDIVLESFFYILTGHIDNFKSLVNVNLRVFIVIGQPVTSLEGIEQLKFLTELWVCECYLHDASHVSKCTEIRKLHLYCNRLKDMPKLSNLKKLSNLSLASNNLSILEPVFPESLRELNLADNNISDISFLSSCKDLEILNLTGNAITTLHALEPLFRLPKLRYLYFTDPMYRFSPVCSLVNYRSYIIHHMEQLKSLDATPVESEERENCRNFYERKFRYYRVLHNCHVNLFATENIKLLSQSYNELNNLKNAIMSATISLNKHNTDSSSVGKECRKKLQKYEVSQFHWDCKQRDWLPRLEKERTVMYNIIELEMSQYGNVNFFNHGKDGGHNVSPVVTKVTEMLQNFICPYTKRNMKLTSVEVDQVVQIVNVQHRHFDQFKGVKDILGIGVLDSQFFIINDPFGVGDAMHWPFSYIKDYLTLKESNSMKCMVTNSIAIADCDWLDKNAVSKNVLLKKDHLAGKRVIVLGYVISDELMGSFTREQTAEAHLKSHDEPAVHCYHCAFYSSHISDNVIPTFIVEFRYIYKDNQYMNYSDDFAIPEGEGLTYKHVTASSKVNFVAWQNLTSISLSKMMISSLGPLATFESVVELDVSYNALRSLQEIAKAFPKLSSLNASSNEIQSANFGKEMPVLKHVSLKYNKLTKYVLSLQWLKKFCKGMDRLEIAYNPLQDVHDLSHMKFTLVKYFPEIRKLDEEWLEHVHGPMIYKFCMKDFPSVLMSRGMFEEIKARPKIQNNGAFCLQDNCTPTSHCAYNQYRELICIYIIKQKPFQSLQIETKKSSLKWLTIKHNLLSNLDVLGECTKLEECDLSYNMIQSISLVFNALKHLTKLNLAGNYIRDVDGFLKIELPSLQVLNLSYNTLRRIEGLRDLKTLEELYVAGNELHKWDYLQFIKDWNNLKIIDLSGNPIEDAEMLRKFLIYHGTHLEYINGTPVCDEEITDANDTLSGTLNKNYLVKIYKPNQIKLLTELTVKKCGIRRANLKDPDFYNLTSVNLDSNALTTLGALSYLKQLKHLCLSNNKITSFGEVKRTFDSLESLHLNSNNITDLVPLEVERFPKLTALFLQDNQLTSAEGLKELRRLQYLVLDRNRIAIVKPEDLQMEALKELYAEYNQIKDLTFLKNLRNLKRLFLAHNKVTDQNSIENFSALKKLTEMTIVGNPVCRLNSCYLLILTQLPKLMTLDGHNVEAQGEPEKHC